MDQLASDLGMTGPLTGLRVLELGHFVSVPFCARILADFGAEVIKVEAPDGGDPMRLNGICSEGKSLWWSSLARNKRLVTLDLRTAEGQKVALELASKCDIVIENFRAGQLEKWNLGWKNLQAANDRVILVRVSAFGQTGPYRDRVAFAPIAEAAGGLNYITADPETAGRRPPVRASVSLGDSITSMQALFGVMAAVYERDVKGTGKGRCVDVAMYESVFAMLDSVVTDYSVLGTIREAAGSSTATFVPSNSYLCKDNNWLFVTASANGVCGRLFEAIGQPELINDARYTDNSARLMHRYEIDAIIGKWAGDLTASEAEETLQAAGVPATRVYSIADCVADPQFVARKAFESVFDQNFGSVLHPGIVPKFDQGGSLPGIRWAGRELGADNEDVYRTLLGMNAERYELLKEQKIV